MRKTKGSINYFVEDLKFTVKDKKRIKTWIIDTIEKEGYNPGEINYIFCSDNYLLELNISYLNHNTLTDIITFNNSDDKQTISGDIFISIERVKDNSTTLSTGFENELARVIIHGILHLCGYKDKTKDQKAEMRSKEEHYINLLNVPRGT
jgi:probable rRNA maturation factor